MATRKTASGKKASNKRNAGKTRGELKKLLKEARAEVNKLLQDEVVRSTEGEPLRCGLKEIRKYLIKLGPLEYNA